MSYKWGYNPTVDIGSYGTTIQQRLQAFNTPSRAQLEQQREAESYTRAAAAQEQIKKKAIQYRINKNLPIFNARFPPRKLSRTRSGTRSRPRSRPRSNKSRKRSRHSV